MTYNITNYSYDKAKVMGIKLYPSKNKKYKIDVYDINNNYITSIGASGYKDYPTYINEDGLKYANERRRLYKLRHNNTRHVKYSRSWLADQILW